MVMLMPCVESKQQSVVQC